MVLSKSPDIPISRPSKSGVRSPGQAKIEAFEKGEKIRSGHPLGTNAKSSSPPTLKQRRAIRYQGLSQARNWAIKHAGATGKKLNSYRVTKCMYVNHGDVGVMRSVAHGTSHFKGLTTCGSVWACPVCAAKIQERRRGEIQQGVDWAVTQGMTPVMVTFTFPHKSFHKLDEMLVRQADAYARLRKGGPWRRFKEQVGYTGLIRSLEVTHGRNGWHPHTHELWFVTNPDEFMRDAGRLTELWASACRKAGLLSDDSNQVTAFMKRSVDVRIADDAAGEYLAKQDDSRKWGVADEMSKANSKAGRLSGVHPHHFLIRRDKGDERLYAEYIDAMKGKRQLFWSKGLKAKAGIGEVTDEELAERTEDPADLLGLLSYDDWRVIRGNDARVEVLDAAESGGWPAVTKLLVALGARGPEDIGILEKSPPGGGLAGKRDVR